MSQIATRKTKLGNLLKADFMPEHGYTRESLTVNVTSTMEIGVVVSNDGDDTYSFVVAADTAIVATPTVENSADYSVSIVGGPISSTFTYTSDVDATATEIVNGLIALIEADVALSAYVTVANVTDTLSITGASSVVALSDNLSIANGLADIAVVIDDTIYKTDYTTPADASVACLVKGPAIIVREQLKFSGAMTDAQIDAVVVALEAKGIKVATQV